MHAMIDLTEPETDLGVTTRGPRVAEPTRPRFGEASIEVGILAYQAAWDAGFRAEIERLAAVFAPLAPTFEHVGTTAIAGSAARPIIDIAVGVARPAAVAFLLENLRNHGYRPLERPESSFGQQMFTRMQRGLVTHHLHVVEAGGTPWQQLLAFRETLRKDTRLAREYEWLRRRFAGAHPANRIAYARAKDTFIRTIVGAAR